MKTNRGKGYSRSWALLLATTVLGTLLTQATLAADRVLIIGVGQYQSNWMEKLPGIDIDVLMGQEIAKQLGFASDTIKILQDQDATYGNIKSAFETWLRDGVEADDHVLIYFSGHGGNIQDMDGDEADGFDEVLYPVDASVKEEGSSVRPEGFLIDDEIGTWLARIPAQHTLMLVDACHSGTITKGGLMPGRPRAVRQYVTKFAPNPVRRPSGAKTVGTKSLKPAGDFSTGDIGFGQSSAYVAVTAAKDDEKSIATDKGSLFTQGLHEVIRQSARDSVALTPQVLVNQVGEFVDQVLPSPGSRFEPQITEGKPGLGAQPLRLTPLQHNNGPVWALFEELSGKGAPLEVLLQPPGPKVNAGEKLKLELHLPAAGYLNIVSVAEDDSVTILFPNGNQPSPAVNAGNFVLPTPAMLKGPVKLEPTAAIPAGKTMIVAILTQEALDLRDSGVGAPERASPATKGKALWNWKENRQTDGRLKSSFSELSPAGQQAIKDAGGSDRTGKVVFTVCTAAGDCGKSAP